MRERVYYEDVLEQDYIKSEYGRYLLVYNDWLISSSESFGEAMTEAYKYHEDVYDFISKKMIYDGYNDIPYFE